MRFRSKTCPGCQNFSIFAALIWPYSVLQVLGGLFLHLHLKALLFNEGVNPNGQLWTLVRYLAHWIQSYKVLLGFLDHNGTLFPIIYIVNCLPHRQLTSSPALQLLNSPAPKWSSGVLRFYVLGGCPRLGSARPFSKIRPREGWWVWGRRFCRHCLWGTHILNIVIFGFLEILKLWILLKRLISRLTIYSMSWRAGIFTNF